MIVYRRVRSQDPKAVFLEWVGLGGEVKQWLFSADNVNTSEVDFTPISSINAYRGIPSDNVKTIALKTFSLSEQEYNFVKDLQFTNLVKATQDGTTLPASIASIKVEEMNPQKLRDFSLEITLQGVLQMTN